MYERGVHEVGDGVWAYLQPDGSWGWSNSGLVTRDGDALLVDTLWDRPLTERMLADYGRVTDARIGVVVNTHANGDHCWGNAAVGDAQIVASTACATEMAELDPAGLAALVAAAPTLDEPAASYLRRVFGPFDFSSVTLRLPDRTFDGELVLHPGGREVRLHEVGPAHTRGDVLVEVPDARVVFTGDIVFSGGHPILWAGPVRNWVAACDRILAMDVDTVVPGHGPVGDKGPVRELREYFVELERAARELFDDGVPLEEATRRLHAADRTGWGDAERLAVNVASLYREFGAGVATDTATLFARMASLAAAG